MTSWLSSKGGAFFDLCIQQPHAPRGYKFFRDVVADYKADNTGATDATEAINAAIADGNRCGEKCSSTFVLGAIIYFPVSQIEGFSPSRLTTGPHTVH